MADTTFIKNLLAKYNGAWVRKLGSEAARQLALALDSALETRLADVGLEVVDTLPAPGTVGRMVYLTTDQRVYVDTGTDSDTYEESVLTDTPRLFLRMNETSGTTAEDASGNGLDGTIGSGVSLNGTSPIIDGSSFGFNNTTNGIVTVAHDALISFAGSFSCEAWVNVANYTNYRFIAHKGPSSGAGNNFPGSLEWRIEQTNGRQQVLRQATVVDTWTSTTAVGTAAWVHVGFAYDGTNNTIRFFRNGVFDNEVATSGIATETNTETLLLGNRRDGGTFDASMDEFTMYNGELADARFAAHYAARQSRGGWIRLAAD